MSHDFPDLKINIILLTTKSFWCRPCFPFPAKNQHFCRVHFNCTGILSAPDNILTATIRLRSTAASFKSGSAWSTVFAEVGAVCRSDDDGGLWRGERCHRTVRDGEQRHCADVLCCDPSRSEGAYPRVSVPSVVEVQFCAYITIHR